MDISFVIPCYCSEKNLEGVISEIEAAMKKREGFEYEIILVNDNSKDNTKGLINRLSKENGRIIGINFAKNFGQPNALLAQKFGRDEAERDVERVLNCDLLILDDLGTEMVTTFVQSALYQIINGRLLEKKSTIVSTNLMPEAIAQRYSGQIASRIEGEYQLLPFVGEDIRVLKKKRGL